jgi:NAD(P)-dependent dehydrogenase (short-subunit alcohol dehydrogenase family)
VIDTNLGGTYVCTKHALPYLEQRKGRVINLHGGGGPLSCAYSVTKDAIQTFTRFVAMEEPDVVIVCISPGSAIATEDAPEEARQRMPGPETVVPAFILAAQARMDMHGKTVKLIDGKLEVVA